MGQRDNFAIDHCCKGRHKQITAPGGEIAIIFPGSPDVPTIQDALDKLVVAGGGTVLLSPGYTESPTVTISFPVNHIAMICPTEDAVITDGSAGGINIINLNGKTHYRIHGIKFVGQGATNITRGIINTVSGCDFGHISRCWFHDCRYGIYGYNVTTTRQLIEWCYFTGHTSWCIFYRRGGALSYSLIRNCYSVNQTFLVSADVGAAGFSVLSWGMSWNTFRDCWVVNGGESCTAFYIGPRGCTGTVYDRCYSYRNGTAFKLKPLYSAAAFTEYRSCLAYQNYLNGFVAGSTYACSPRYIGCSAIDNSYTHNNVFSGFLLANADRAILQSCKGYQSSGQQKYGAHIQSTCDKVELRGGVWSPNQTLPWFNEGTNTIEDARDN